MSSIEYVSVKVADEVAFHDLVIGLLNEKGLERINQIKQTLLDDYLNGWDDDPIPGEYTPCEISSVYTKSGNPEQIDFYSEKVDVKPHYIKVGDGIVESTQAEVTVSVQDRIGQGRIGQVG